MSDRPRIGMISFAHMHAFSYLQVLLSMRDIELIGIADDDAERGRQVATDVGLPYLDSEMLLEEADGVIVTTENVRHRENVLRAAQAGVDVMCEKPLATTMEDGREMISACREAGVQLMTAFPCRFAPRPIADGIPVVGSCSQSFPVGARRWTTLCIWLT